MRGAIGLIVLLIVLTVLAPFACAATYEAWTDGLYDAELDGDIFAVLSLAAVIDGTVLNAGDCLTVLVAIVVLINDHGGDLTEPSTRSARAPPVPLV